MLRNWVLYGLQLLFLWIAWPVCSQNLPAQPFPLSDKIRAAFWGINAVEEGEKQLRLLQTYGFNTALVNDSWYQVKETLWGAWGQIAEKYAINLFPIHSFAGTEEIKTLKGQFRPYINRQGQILPATPCPLDEAYWNVSIGQRFAQLAHISTTTRLTGLLFDTEMYGSDVSAYPEVCFCDICWAKFIQAKQPDLAATLARAKRFETLRQRALPQSYTNFQQTQLQMILAAIEQQIHRINPKLMLGFLAYQDNWFYRGLITGLGNAARPILVFSETTYVRGYTPAVTAEKTAIETPPQTASNSQPIARYLPGLWLGRFFPEDISSQAYDLATHAAGYWIFTAYSLWTTEQTAEPYALHGTGQEYWAAFQQANNELQRFSTAPESYRSSLPPVKLASFYDISQNRLLTQPALKELLHKLALSGIPDAVKRQMSQGQPSPGIVYRGKTLWHCFKNPSLNGLKGDLVGAIRITHVPLEPYPDPTSYTLFDHNGVVFQEGVLDQRTRVAEITLPANISGVVSILTDSGANLTKVAFAGIPYVIEASSTFPLATFNTAQTYAVYGGAAEKPRKLRAYCSSAEESAFITLQAPAQTLRQQAEIIEFTEMKMPYSVSPDNLNFWTITVSPVPAKGFEDLLFYLYDEEFPYLSPTQ